MAKNNPSAGELINKYMERNLDKELDELPDPGENAPSELCNDIENEDEAPKKKDSSSSSLPTVAAVAVVAAGVVVVEASLLPGVILGVVAVSASSALPWLFKKTVKGIAKAGKKGREFLHETNEKIEDIIAEVEGEDKQKNG